MNTQQTLETWYTTCAGRFAARFSDGKLASLTVPHDLISPASVDELCSNIIHAVNGGLAQHLDEQLENAGVAPERLQSLRSAHADALASAQRAFQASPSLRREFDQLIGAPDDECGVTDGPTEATFTHGRLATLRLSYAVAASADARTVSISVCDAVNAALESSTDPEPAEFEPDYVQALRTALNEPLETRSPDDEAV